MNPGCNQCEYPVEVGHEQYADYVCNHPNNKDKGFDAMRGMIFIRQRCCDRNKDGDCPHFIPKRGWWERFVTWVLYHIPM